MGPGASRTDSHAQVFRHSVPIRLGAYGILWGGCVLFTLAGVYPFPIAAVTLITLVESAVLGLVRRRAQTSRALATAYLLVEALAQTAIFHVSGPLRIAFAPTVYTAELLNPGVRLDRRQHFVVANGFVALFAGVIALERAGVLGATRYDALALSPRLDAASIVIAFLCLNLVAFFISAMRVLLEAKTAEVERKADELRTFVHGVTHDLKAPLNSILLTADFMLRDDAAALGDDARRDLQHIVETAGRGEDMLRDLLRLFEVTSGAEESGAVDLGRLVAASLEMYRPQLESRGIRVTVGSLPTVQGQETKLSHLIANLIDNAVKYVHAESGAIGIEGESANGRAIVRVRDNGIGIPAAYHGHIFELFGRAPESRQRVDGALRGGSGVGLALAKRIVEEHGGRISVTSVPGEGSCFVVELPAAR